MSSLSKFVLPDIIDRDFYGMPGQQVVLPVLPQGAKYHLLNSKDVEMSVADLCKTLDLRYFCLEAIYSLGFTGDIFAEFVKDYSDLEDFVIDNRLYTCPVFRTRAKFAPRKSYNYLFGLPFPEIAFRFTKWLETLQFNIPGPKESVISYGCQPVNFYITDGQQTMINYYTLALPIRHGYKLQLDTEPYTSGDEGSITATIPLIKEVKINSKEEST